MVLRRNKTPGPGSRYHHVIDTWLRNAAHWETELLASDTTVTRRRAEDTRAELTQALLVDAGAEIEVLTNDGPGALTRHLERRYRQQAIAA